MIWDMHFGSHEPRSRGKGRRKSGGAFRGATPSAYGAAETVTLPVRRNTQGHTRMDRVAKFEPLMVYEFLDYYHQYLSASAGQRAARDIRIPEWMYDVTSRVLQQVKSSIDASKGTWHFSDKIVKIRSVDEHFQDGTMQTRFYPEVQPNKNANRVSKKQLLMERLAKMTEQELLEVVRVRCPAMVAMLEGGTPVRKVGKRQINI